MAGLSAKTQPLIDPTLPYPTDVGRATQQIRQTRLPMSEALAAALENLQANTNQIQRALRQAAEMHELVVRDMTGRIIAALGEFEVNGIQYNGGVFAELYAGFPNGITDPGLAIIKVLPTGEVSIGQNGWLDVLDPFGRAAAWLGTQYDTLPVTGAVNNGSGLIRLTVTGHTLLTGDTVPVHGVGGLVDGYGDSVAQGVFTVTKIDANHIDLQNSIFLGTYTSGGTVARLLHISGAANNGSGLIRITTAVAHTYITGDQVNIVAVGGVPNATGQWIITVIDATHFDLEGSTFAGTYTSGGTVLRYFAGGLFQTIAVGGTTFANAKLRALANGDLDITDAHILLTGPTGVIELNPGNPPTIEIRTVGLLVDVFLSMFPGTIQMFYEDNSFALQITPTILEMTASGAPRVSLDATTGTVTAFGHIRTDDVFNVNGSDGLTEPFSKAVSLTVNDSNNGVFGTPAAGQSNGTVVTGVSLNFVVKQFTGGILTA